MNSKSSSRPQRPCAEVDGKVSFVTALLGAPVVLYVLSVLGYPPGIPALEAALEGRYSFGILPVLWAWIGYCALNVGFEVLVEERCTSSVVHGLPFRAAAGAILGTAAGFLCSSAAACQFGLSTGGTSCLPEISGNAWLIATIVPGAVCGLMATLVARGLTSSNQVSSPA